MIRSSKIILIIDDDTTIRKLVSYNLRKQGFEVFEASGATTGMEQLKKVLPDLVLCDIMMDDMDGYEFVKLVRSKAEYAALPFIFVSAKSSLEDKSLAAELGADDFVSKPFKMEDLILKVNTLLKRSEIYRSYSLDLKKTQTTNEEPCRILIVDDDRMFLKRIQASLIKESFIVEIADNALDGFDIAKNNTPDLILSDIIMPDTDGFEFKKLISADRVLKSVPFVFLTSKTEDEDILKGYEEGIYDYILKASSIEVIVKKVITLNRSLSIERAKVVEEFHQVANQQKAKVVPNKPPVLPGYVIEQLHIPFKNIPGGDFIDYIKLNNDQYALILGDVMGKKWGAWFFAFAYAGYIRSAVRFVSQSLEGVSAGSPAQVLKKLNTAVFEDIQISEIFTTISIVFIDLNNKTIKYAGAGDLPIFLRRAKSNEIIMVKSEGILIGLKENGEYEDIVINLEFHDELLLATDGLAEAKNLRSEQFGIDRIQDSLKSNSEFTFLDKLKDRLDNFTGNNLDDDISIIWMKRIS